ncbi:MAG: alpha-hydroxy acid oxidase [Egibacteraceae bacterium]
MNVATLQGRARQLLDRAAYDYYAGGSDDELTLADNPAAWSRLRLRPHVLRDVGGVDVATTVLGEPVATPILIAPMAYQRLAHDEGEAATARAAAEVGTVMIVSTLANISLEDVAATAPQALRWFQLYVHVDRGFSLQLVRRAETAGYRALVLTVDVPVPGRRRRDEANQFFLPEGMTMANVGRAPAPVEGSALAAYAVDAFDPTLTFSDIGWLREHTDLPIVVKGVLRGDDAVEAVAAGAAAIVVSNHGARQLDTAVATADVLAEVAGAVGGRAEVYVDGGVCRGTDIVKALALGARAVLVGRPVLWGLACGGAKGVFEVVRELTDETAHAFMLCGVTTCDQVTRDLVV